MNQRKVRSNIMLIAAAMIWGFAFVAQSVGMDYVEPFTFNAVRILIAGIVLVIYILFRNSIDRRKNIRPQVITVENRRNLIVGGVLCGIALFAASSLQQIGLQYTTAGKAGFITALYIVIVPLLGIISRRKVSVKVWVGVLIAVIGMYLLCINDGFTINKGDILVVLCAFIFSIHILIIDRYSPLVDGVIMSCIQFFTCGILSIIPMVIFESPNIASILQAWLPILYAGALSGGVAYTLQIIGQKGTDPSVSSLLLSLESVFAALGGFIILNEIFTEREFIGCLLIFSAVIITQLPEKRPMRINSEQMEDVY
ncbi:DMT family transporter [Alloiococcus sp. CFN-8]|uniref:DMT family transporter n=1 Tax=Alloiococcus sp. CFN-8 TaxID=3416081 RepID=UPI003CEE7532